MGMTDAEWHATRAKEQAEFDALKKRQANGEGIIIVYFSHDLEDSWYEGVFPDHSLDGAYSFSHSIAKVAFQKGWTIHWVGDQYYNPWK